MCVFTHASHAVLILLRTCTSAVSATHEKVHYELRLPSAFQLSPPLDRYTAVFTLGGGFCDVCFFFCFFFQGSVSWTEENTTRKKRLVSHTSHKQKEGGKKRKKEKTANAFSYTNICISVSTNRRLQPHLPRTKNRISVTNICLSTQKEQTHKTPSMYSRTHARPNICRPSEWKWRWAAHVFHRGFSGFTR